MPNRYRDSERLPVSPSVDSFINRDLSTPVDSTNNAPVYSYARGPPGLPVSAFDELIAVSSAALHSEEQYRPKLPKRLTQGAYSTEAIRNRPRSLSANTYLRPTSPAHPGLSATDNFLRASNTAQVFSAYDVPASKPKRVVTRRKLPPTICSACHTSETPGWLVSVLRGNRF